jgi:hypothetical protein
VREGRGGTEGGWFDAVGESRLHPEADMQVTMGRRAVTAFILAGLCLVAVVVLNHQRASTSSLLDESRLGHWP